MSATIKEELQNVKDSMKNDRKDIHRNMATQIKDHEHVCYLCGETWESASEPLRLLNYWYRERGSIAKEAYDEIKHALESNCAAHASEPWIGGRCKFCNEDEGRHKPDCRAAQASEETK